MNARYAPVSSVNARPTHGMVPPAQAPHCTRQAAARLGLPASSLQVVDTARSAGTESAKMAAESRKTIARLTSRVAYPIRFTSFYLVLHRFASFHQAFKAEDHLFSWFKELFR